MFGKGRECRQIQAVALAVVCIAFACFPKPSTRAADEFEPTVESLRAYECPEWFRDAKFGIYVHWGVYSVVERGEWYPRYMYMPEREEYKHHLKTYGHPSEFGYKDFIPMWQAEKFAPDRLIALFKRAGAKYFTPCAVHHDNFDLWDSKHHRYNSVNMGPKKDITMLWQQAARKHGLRFGVTTHLARSYSWFQVNKGADTSGPYAGVPYDGHDPAWRDYYHPHSEDANRQQPKDAPEHWRTTWSLRIKDLIDNYDLDFLYFDSSVPFLGDDQGKTGLDVIAHFYNQTLRRHNGTQDGVLTIKHREDQGIYIDGIATLDIERDRSDELKGLPWQTDTSIGPWGYNTESDYRSVNDIIDELVDIVSKNGNMLLNVPPRADGTLDSETEKILLDIGKWLNINGEAIYDTRPWFTYGEDKLRFTKKDSVLYIIALEWPGNNILTVPSSVFGEKAGSISGVSLLGYEGRLQSRREETGFEVTMPETKPCEHAWCLKFVFDGAER